MVWCDCSVRCKGGREVSKKTRAKHRKECEEQALQQLVQQHFPEGLASLSATPGRRRRHAGDNTEGTRSKKARMGDEQGGSAEIQPVRIPTNFAQLKLMSR